MDKFSRRTVKVTREHNEECRKLLRLMGIPVIVVRERALSVVIPTYDCSRHRQRPKPNVPSWLGEAKLVA